MLGQKVFFTFVFFCTLSISASAQVTCPPGWSPFGDGTKCRPSSLPSTDYFYPTGNDQRPICGSDDGHGNYRIPVLPTFEPLLISTSTTPNSSIGYTGTSGIESVPTTKSTTDSAYLYESLTRCVCMNGNPVLPDTTLAPNKDTDRFTPGGNFHPNYTRIYPDTYDVISTQNQNATIKYNMVAYTADESKEGRDGINFSGNASGVPARCGCPNSNETPVSNGSGTGIIGVHCEPKLGASQGRILTTYSSSFHGPSANAVFGGVMGNQVQDASDESLDGMSVVSKILIPTHSGGTQLYQRKIWTCAPPYKTSSSSQSCVAPTMTDHACSNGGGTAQLASPVSVEVTGQDAVIRFDNTINKKLACCMNSMSTVNNSGAFIKFDCVDNSSNTYTNFDSLWGSADSSNDGGQSNALVLSGSLGKYLTGFYTVDGVRCDEYSEFADSYAPTKVIKGSGGTWVTQTVSGSTTITPPSALRSIFSSKKVPSTALEMKRCPIVARAAMVATCPPKTELPVVQKTYVDSSGLKHCSSASGIQVHVRIEQIFEIEGMPKMKTVDTVAERRLASSISVESIISNKNGGACPGGATKQGDVCVYQ